MNNKINNATMNAVKITAIKQASMLISKSLSKSDLPNDWGMVDVAYCGICGSDTHVYNGHHPKIKPPAKMIQGHEASGVITYLPNNISTALKVGMKVAINPLIGCQQCIYCNENKPNLCIDRKVLGFQLDGTMANQVSLPIANIIPLSESVDLVIGALLEPLVVGLHAINLLSSQEILAHEIIVTGAGTIGAMLAFAIEAKYHKKAILIERHIERQALLRSSGFEVYDDLASVTLSQRPIVFECTGYEPILAQTLTLQPAARTVVVVGQYPKDATLSLFDLTKYETCVIGSQMYTDDDWIEGAALLQTPLLINTLNKIIHEEIFPLSQVNNAFQMALAGCGGKLKVLIDCQA